MGQSGQRKAAALAHWRVGLGVARGEGRRGDAGVALACGAAGQWAWRGAKLACGGMAARVGWAGLERRVGPGGFGRRVTGPRGAGSG